MDETATTLSDMRLSEATSSFNYQTFKRKCFLLVEELNMRRRIAVESDLRSNELIIKYEEQLIINKVPIHTTCITHFPITTNRIF